MTDAQSGSQVKPVLINRRLAVLSALAGTAASALVLMFRHPSAFTFPGAIIEDALFGRQRPLTNLPLRLVLNAAGLALIVYLGALVWRLVGQTVTRFAGPATKAILAVWVVLLIPWLLYGPLSAMAFDGGDTPSARMFFWLTFTYPVSVAFVAALRRWFPYIALLPLVNLFGFFFPNLLLSLW